MVEDEKLLYLQALRDSMAEFINEIGKCVCHNSDEKNDIFLVTTLIRATNADNIYENIFVPRVLPYRDQLEKRDISYFNRNLNIFEGLPEDKVKKYNDRVYKEMSDENKQVMFDYFDSFFAIHDIISK